MRGVPLLVGLAASAALMTLPALAAEYHFERVAVIRLDGNTGHGDITTFDPSNGMLYVSMAKNGLNVVDTHTDRVVKYIDDVPSPNGSDWDANHVYVAAADGPGPLNTNAIVVIDKKTWTEVGRVETQGTSPDWIHVDRKDNLIYVDSDDDNFMEVYSTGDHPQFKAKWPLYPDRPSTGPDVAMAVPSLHSIFQSDDSYVEVVNTATGAIERHMDTGVTLTSKGGTKGEIYDAKNHRLWVGTTNPNPGMFVLNPDTLAVIKKIPEKGGVDVVAFDPGLGLVYAFEGGAKGFDVYDANTMEHVAFVSTGIGQTHTGDVDPESHLVFAYCGNDRQVMVFKPTR
ncbi:MAG TPA: hypothetical protein VMF53_06845 [Alphaproteobacteria bacterium]|nr:hypothetical protein [Alphaproteobacteria bacterium]